MKLLPKTCALFSLLCASALVLCSCSGRGTPPQAAQSTPSPAPSVDTSGFQQNMCVSNVFRMNSVCQTPFGYYLQSEGIVYALDPQTKRMAPVCSRPECRHGDEHCNGWINSLFLSYYNGMVYYANSDSEDCWHLYAMQPDGTGHRKIQSIQFEATGMIHSYQPMLYNGTVYFIDSGALYSVALGADIHTAVRLLAEDSTGKLESSWKFWADDSAAYAMNHVLRADGVYQDVLYQLGTDEAGTKELWRSSQTQVPQQRDSCSSWYISHGQLYYYASGNDVWRIDLNSGQAHQLIGLTGVLESGTAVFSQSAIAVLNDTPDPQWGPQSGYRSGGDTLRIYDYTGVLRREISLSAIYQAYPDVAHCTMVFADDSSVYLLAYRGMEHSPSSVFYQISQDSGALNEIAGWIGSALNPHTPDWQEEEGVR